MTAPKFIPSPPKAFSLSILKNRATEINKNKDELKAFLGEIMANKKSPLRSDSAKITPGKQKEIPQDVLEDLLAVKSEE